MKQVMLHLADNFSKDRQHAAQDTQVIHQPQAMNNSCRLLKDREKELAVFFRATELAINAITMVPQGTQCARSHAV